MKQALLLFDESLSKLGKRGNLLLAVLLAALLGWLDYATGFEISFSFFYLIPVTLVTWYIGIRVGILFTFVSVLTWLFTNWLAGEAYSSEWIRFFNASVRLIVFSMIAFLLHELKAALETEQRSARTDFLTGVLNRREFTNRLSVEIKRARRLAYPVTFAYIDLDNFKNVNDEKGHSAGDEHLRIIAQAITTTIRETDLFARLGGDEFGLFLPDSDQKNAEAVIGKISRRVMHELSLMNSPVTLSIGVITFSSPPDHANEVLHEADALMYKAKQSGKRQAIYNEINRP